MTVNYPELLTDNLISLASAVVQLLVPLIIAATTQRGIKKGHFAIICCGWTIIFSIIFVSFWITGNTAHVPNVVSALFWCFISYKLGKTILLRRELLPSPLNPTPSDADPLTGTSKNDAAPAEQLEPPETEATADCVDEEPPVPTEEVEATTGGSDEIAPLPDSPPDAPDEPSESDSVPPEQLDPPEAETRADSAEEEPSVPHSSTPSSPEEQKERLYASTNELYTLLGSAPNKNPMDDLCVLTVLFCDPTAHHIFGNEAFSASHTAPYECISFTFFIVRYLYARNGGGHLSNFTTLYLSGMMDCLPSYFHETSSFFSDFLEDSLLEYDSLLHHDANSFSASVKDVINAFVDRLCAASGVSSAVNSGTDTTERLSCREDADALLKEIQTTFSEYIHRAVEFLT